MSDKRLEELMRLDGRKALVTGATGHCGRMACQTLMDLGAQVIATDRSSEKLMALGQDLPGLIDVVAADFTNLTQILALAEKVIFKYETLSLLVHAAALTGTGDGIREGWAVPFEGQTAEAFNYSLQVNLTAPFVLLQELHESMAASGHGSVILFGSIYGLVAPAPSLYAGIDGANEGPVGYSAAKGGTVQLTRHLAAMLAPDVRVNCLTPGGLERGQSEEFQRRYSSRTPLARMGTESDLRGAVAFLASDMSEYMTGQNLIIDGGFTTW